MPSLLNSFFLTPKEMTALSQKVAMHLKDPEEFLREHLIYALLRTDDVATLKKMIRRGFTFDKFQLSLKHFKKTPHNHAIFLSIQFGSRKIFNYLLSQKMDIHSAAPQFGGNPLFFAAVRNNLYCFEKLLSKGADTCYIADEATVLHKKTLFVYLLNNLTKNGELSKPHKNILKKTIAAKELTPAVLHSEYLKENLQTVFEKLLYSYPSDIFDTLIQNIQSADTLLTLKEPINKYEQKFIHQSTTTSASQKLEARICEIERNQLAQELTLAKDSPKTILKI